MDVDLFVVLAIGAIVLLIYHYISQKYHYFLAKPIPCLKPTFLLGSSGPALFRKRDIATHLRLMYNTHPDSKLIGVYDFTSPSYLVRDPEVVKKIGVKDFDFFTDHTPLVPADETATGEVGEESLFLNTLFALRGQKWRDMRATLSPAFTGSKMRHMFQLVAECARSMNGFFAAEAKTGKRLECEMKDTFSRFSNDVIATVAFGIQVNSLKERDNEFYTAGKEMVNFQSFTTLMKFMLMTFAPRLMKKLKIDFLSSKLKKYFKEMILDNMKQRNVHGIVRNDMIDILIQVQKGVLEHQTNEKETKDAGFATVEESTVGKSTNSRVWTENELIAQCLLFFLAGFETVSTCMTFLTYELLANRDVQDRLHREILETEQSLNGEPLSYEVLLRMPYMDMVVSEALRLWPPAVLSERSCSKNYLYDDGAGTRFTIEKGRSLLIPSFAIHRDSKYWERPDQFDPERFSEENRSKINPAAYIPFGIGPRNCIGSRLALMEVKLVVYYLLRDFSLEPTEKSEIPLRLKKGLFTMIPENGVWLEVKPRSES
ncbi:probable cytochrome P450 9f2 [Sabethes cyaneus]|uniref:probable cytochrome P450 9f2 n=1 Tax=Sabethes cyaneus TaxID=53552 RepID=UPI00237E194C|nr:probable cytochrome P450 9f2 [Sabethes cyaneus]